MRNRLVRLPNGDYVNPAHVSSIDIDPTETDLARIATRVWLNGIATSYAFPGDRRDEFANLFHYYEDML